MSRPEPCSVDLVSFAHPILINLADRPQRLRDSLAELSAATGRPVEAGRDVHLIRPVRFTDPGGFGRPGYRSNLDAHLRAARWARDRGLDRVLVLEDDLAFSPAWAGAGPTMIEQLTDRRWDLASLGYLDEWGEAPTAADGQTGRGSGPGWARFAGKVNGAHAYLLQAAVLDDWIDHLQAVLDGEPGDDLRGPMPSDGAINTFFWIDPDRIRLLAVPNMVGTRPTRSDIAPGPVDRIPLVGAALERIRRWNRSHRRSSSINY